MDNTGRLKASLLDQKTQPRASMPPTPRKRQSKIIDTTRARKSSVATTRRGGASGKKSAISSDKQPYTSYSSAKELRALRWDFEEALSPADAKMFESLKQFDMCVKYGPCRSMTRDQRWAMAERFGQDPPREVKDMLDNTELQERWGWKRLHLCLWHDFFVE